MSPPSVANIKARINSGQARKMPDQLRGLADSLYFVDQSGAVFSMHGDTPRVIEANVDSRTGRPRVTLKSDEGYVRRDVAFLVAMTFCGEDLMNLGARPEQCTVVQKNGDLLDVRAENLVWMTREQAAGNAAQPIQMANTPAPEGASNPPVVEAPTVENVGEHDTEVAQADLARERALHQRLKGAQRRAAELERALSQLRLAVVPFGQFVLGPAHRSGAKDDVVLESNKGRPDHSTLTVGDFAALRKALEGDLNAPTE